MDSAPEHTRFVSRGRLNGVLRQHPGGGGPLMSPRPSQGASSTESRTWIPRLSKLSTTGLA